MFLVLEQLHVLIALRYVLGRQRTTIDTGVSGLGGRSGDSILGK